MDRRSLLVMVAALAATPAFSQSRQRLRFAVTDVDGAENLQREFGPSRRRSSDFCPTSNRAFPRLRNAPRPSRP